MTRVAVFLDYQNVYQGARGVFGWQHDSYTAGQIFPRRVGVLLTDRGRQVDPARQLVRVAAFRGEPSSVHSPKGQSACDRQVRFWRAQAAVDVATRPLKYYPYHDEHGALRWAPREKGIDVHIALEMVMGAFRDQFDVAILFSGDSDLIPAIEEVRRLGKRCEVAAWDGRANRQRLSIPGGNVWCHWLTEADYRLVEDSTDYTLPVAGTPPANP